MGDRTYCELKVRTQDVKKALDILGHAKRSHVVTHNDEIAVFGFEEVNYGSLDEEIRDALVQAGIPFNWSWGTGADYGAGETYCRFTEDGAVRCIDLFEHDINPNVNELLALIDEPIKLREYVLDFVAARTPLSWESQEENSKRYRMLRLIN
jgi:hypothetical protein